MRGRVPLPGATPSPGRTHGPDAGNGKLYGHCPETTTEDSSASTQPSRARPDTPSSAHAAATTFSPWWSHRLRGHSRTLARVFRTSLTLPKEVVEAGGLECVPQTGIDALVGSEHDPDDERSPAARPRTMRRRPTARPVAHASDPAPPADDLPGAARVEHDMNSPSSEPASLVEAGLGPRGATGRARSSSTAPCGGARPAGSSSRTRSRSGILPSDEREPGHAPRTEIVRQRP